MKIRILIFSAFIISFLLGSSQLSAKKIINLHPTIGDMTSIVREQLEKTKEKEIEIVFEKGIYHFHPEYAFGKYCAITNHDNGWKKIIFLFDGYDEVIIKGNGAELIFHGQAFPFQFENCEKVEISGITIDWDIPFTIQGEVIEINLESEWIDLKMFTTGYSWELKNGKITFPNIDGFSYSQLGSSLAFDSQHKRVAHGAFDRSSQPRWVENRKNGIIRIHEKLNHSPNIGDIVNFKGPKGENRYAPAFHLISSKNIHINNVVVHHALGMGFLMERSENATLSNCGVYVREGSDRVVSITADATHFCNCKGDILIENCRFENMLDDGTNVHGTYVSVDKKIDEFTLLIKLEHFQQLGFEFAAGGDELWLIQQPDPKRGEVIKVKSVNVLNERYSELKFANKLPEKIRKGDLLENKTWNPTFTMRGCTIKDHRARNIVLKTPKKVVIENNEFSSMMSSILFRGESFYWYESGALEDVLIQNNRFNYCAYSGAEHAILYITPRLGKSFDQTITFDRNIRFVNNTISTFDHRIVWADRVDGLYIIGNTINHKPTQNSLYPNASLFDFTHCRNLRISGNTYIGDHQHFFKTDKSTLPNLYINKNNGIPNGIKIKLE